jgi:hypothetical protein
MSRVDLPTVGSVGSVGFINGWWDQLTAENPSDNRIPTALRIVNFSPT